MTELKGDSPAVPEANQNSTESRSSERDSTKSRSSGKDSTDEPSTEMISTGSQASERSSTSVLNLLSTEKPEVGSKLSEETWRQVWTQGSRNRSDNSEVERDLLGGNSDSKSGGRPSRYFHDWFNSKGNKYENDLESNQLDEPEENQEWQKPIEMGSQEGCLKKHRKHRSKQLVKPTGFRDIMMSISMAGPGEKVSRNEQPKPRMAIRFGKGNNIPDGMKFAVGREAWGYKDKQGPQKDSSDPSDSSDSEESSGEEQPRKHGVTNMNYNSKITQVCQDICGIKLR